MYNIMAVYIAAAYRLSPIDPVTIQVKKNVENDITNYFCSSDVKTVKRQRATNELRDRHSKDIEERIANYEEPTKYNSEDIKEFIVHNKKKLVSEVKDHIWRGALTDPIIIITILAIIGIIVWTVMCWIKDCNNTLKWSLTFGCWILVYLSVFTGIQISRLQKNIERVIDKEIDNVEENIIEKMKILCPGKVSVKDKKTKDIK